MSENLDRLFEKAKTLELTYDEWFAETDEGYDFSAHLTQMGDWEPKEPWEMYSYDRPSVAYWHGFANALFKQGYTLREVQTYLQARTIRHMFDVAFEDEVTLLGAKHAKKVTKEEMEFLSNERRKWDERQRERTGGDES